MAVPLAAYQLINILLNVGRWFSPEFIELYGGWSRVPVDVIQGLGQIGVGLASALGLISLILAFHVLCAELLSRATSILLLGTQLGLGGLLMHANTHTWVSATPSENGFQFVEFDYGRIRLRTSLNHSRVYGDPKAIGIICDWLTAKDITPKDPHLPDGSGTSAEQATVAHA